MKNKLTTLPGLQAAAALYLARTSEAKVFCADANRTVVPNTSCVDVETSGQFFVFGKNVTDIALHTQVEPEINIYDASDVVLRQNAKYPPPPNAPAPQKSRSLVLRDNDEDYVCDSDAPGQFSYTPVGGRGRLVVIGLYGRGSGSLGG
ncbi:hypothetical protein LY78DRAFT_320620 [Colletotrichum sublineola]|uniref:Uncharacterized protein n=1 Tax=Colletotrichum sublineola TaxID=1173701 RepID=A0A066XCN6_COLSU|nr:hypothetical protein LY78DRAFT_320620 [Colletotrichum sublineola]KDN66953.1 hypothetical protein CSUB01_11543 [Colletotrichum sublineola]